MRIEDFFSEEELSAAISVDTSSRLLLTALRSGTRHLLEFGRTKMTPVFVTLVANKTDLESALGTCYYRMIGCLEAMCQLEDPRFFQALSGSARTIVELAMDVTLLCGPRPLEHAVARFHGFTRAARFEAASKTAKFYDKHPELEEPSFAADRRAFATSEHATEIEVLCQRLWGQARAPHHWSGMNWTQVAERSTPELAEIHAQWFALMAWHVHGGAAGVGGISTDGFAGMEVLSREIVRDSVPEAFRLIGNALHMHRAVPRFFEDLHFVRDYVETLALVDAKLVSLGRRSKVPPREDT